MKYRVTISFIVVIVVIIGMVFWSKESTDIPVGEQKNVPSSLPYKDAAYTIEGKTISLVDGYSEIEIAPGSASKIITRYFGNEAEGDLNGDGISDVAFLLTQESGGSGTFYYVVATLKTGAGYEGTNAVLLGDRIAPQTTEIQDGAIIVNYADRREGEPMTAEPSVGVSRYLRVENRRLVEIRK